MSEENNSTKKKISIEWLMRGVLTKLGDTFDRLTGRRWTPSSSLATSELSEKLKKLLDLEVKDLGVKGKFVPHNIKLKMQWDKFSTDSEDAIRRLENELKIAAIDHINDNRYHTYAPLRLEIAPDYFTEGVKLLVSFDKFDEEKREAAVNVTVPQIKVGDYMPEPPPEIKAEAPPETFIARFALNGAPKQIELKFKEKDRKSVGRTKENNLSLEDPSVSKIHAALVLNSEKHLMVADTGSTNGTFINEKRIAYGRAFPIAANDKVKFGNIEVVFEYVPRAVENASLPESMSNQPATEAFSASQSDIQTVAFNSNEDFTVKREDLPPPSSAGNIQPKEIQEPNFMQVKPEIEPEAKPDLIEKAETHSTGTQDRINYEFSNEE
jgi:pSer/pThr/pTyr-binding forkhead associated (FHA) protein